MVRLGWLCVLAAACTATVVVGESEGKVKLVIQVNEVKHHHQHKGIVDVVTDFFNGTESKSGSKSASKDNDDEDDDDDDEEREEANEEAETEKDDDDDTEDPEEAEVNDRKKKSHAHKKGIVSDTWEDIKDAFNGSDSNGSADSGKSATIVRKSPSKVKVVVPKREHAHKPDESDESDDSDSRDSSDPDGRKMKKMMKKTKMAHAKKKIVAKHHKKEVKIENASDSGDPADKKKKQTTIAEHHKMYPMHHKKHRVASLKKQKAQKKLHAPEQKKSHTQSLVKKPDAGTVKQPETAVKAVSLSQTQPKHRLSMEVFAMIGSAIGALVGVVVIALVVVTRRRRALAAPTVEMQSQEAVVEEGTMTPDSVTDASTTSEGEKVEGSV